MWRYVNNAEVYEVKRFEENEDRFFYPYYLGGVTGACPVEGVAEKLKALERGGETPPS